MSYSDLTVKQKVAISFLAAGESVIESARKSGIAEKTLHNWLKKPEFLESLEIEKTEYLKRVQFINIERIRNTAIKGGEALDSIANSLLEKYQVWADELSLDELNDTNKIKLLSELRALMEMSLNWRGQGWAVDKLLDKVASDNLGEDNA